MSKVGHDSRETLNKSTTSFRRTPESSQIKHLDPGVRRGDDLFRTSLGTTSCATRSHQNYNARSKQQGCRGLRHRKTCRDVTSFDRAWREWYEYLLFKDVADCITDLYCGECWREVRREGRANRVEARWHAVLPCPEHKFLGMACSGLGYLIYPALGSHDLTQIPAVKVRH